jgi:Lon protease-like protein
MEETIPLFPLKLVAFPGEKVNLHIFEPRYKDLIQDVLAGNKRFGIPAYINNNLEFGTLMEIIEVSKTYDDGRMDIRTKGLKIFRILDFNNPSGDKKYSSGTVQYIDNHTEQDPYLKNYMVEKLEEFFEYIHFIGEVSVNEELVVYDIVHKLGLTLEEEYAVLSMNREIDRQEFITNYLDKTLPALKRAEKAKDIIKMNGHFKYLDPINF